MIDFNAQAVDNFISHLWMVIQQNGMMAQTTIDQYGLTVIPIAPANDNPEFANHMGQNPYIIYDLYSYPVSPTEYWRYRDEVVLTIYCPDFGVLQKLVQFLKYMYGRAEESVALLNDHINPDNPFIYHTCEFTVAQTYRPVQDEGGRLASEVTISYEYTRDWTA